MIRTALPNGSSLHSDGDLVKVPNDMGASVRSRRWCLQTPRPGVLSELRDRLSISPLAALVLANRGVHVPEEAGRFLQPSFSHLHPPFEMLDMQTGVDRLVRAVSQREPVAVYGDYDMDGVSAAALLYLFFKEAGIPGPVYIPNRLREGYGLNVSALESLAKQGVRLIVTVDCGISGHAEVEAARRLGMDVIITDHHEPGAIRPQALAVVNPKQETCPFPDLDPAGVGVAFCLAVSLRAALRKRLPDNPAAHVNLKSFLDLVALGTIADLVPLKGQNRIWVKAGLELLASSPRPGIESLKRVAAIKPGVVTEWDVAFRLAPRFNAAGRTGSAMDAFDLLTTADACRAADLAGLLEERNRTRKQLEAHLLKQVLRQVEDRAVECSRSLVASGDRWHRGVLGITASRLKDRFNVPALLIGVDEQGIGLGSGRSVPGLHLHQTLTACRHHLIACGGHAGAAGFRIEAHRIPAFADEFDALVRENLPEEPSPPLLNIDGKISLEDLTLDAVHELQNLAPFGVENPEPVFLSEGVEVVQWKVLQDSHLKLTLRGNNGCAATGIGFDLAPALPAPPAYLDVVFTPVIDRWADRENVQLRILDVGIP